MSATLVLSCEHGGRRVPARYAYLFASTRAQRALASHRGCDDGALDVARALARRFGVELHAATVTRLLVDLNRSPHHRALFSEFSVAADAKTRERILARYYYPHRERIRSAVAAARAPVVHVAVHSFVPRLGGRARHNDVGLLYDPRRAPELLFCRRWQRLLHERDPRPSVRRNYPYLGRADGLTTALRRELDAERYLGIELEINLARLTRAGRARTALVDTIGATLVQLLERPC